MSNPKSMFSLGADYERLCMAAGRGEHPDTGEPIEDFAELDALFDAIQDDVGEKIAATAYVTQRLKADAGVLAEEIKRLQAKKASIEANNERLKDKLREFMETTETPKVKTPSVSVSLGKPTERVSIVDEDAVPEDYAEVVRRVSKSAVKDALKQGLDVSGAKLVPGPKRLTIR